jgi:hypothetical protein
MIDEEEDCRAFDVIICIGRPSTRLKAPFLIAGVELDKLIGHSRAMELSNPFNGRRS